ncbi:MAG TPA: 23S rRNA (uracil(1939)-C(5))-methyltransferase RlmD [Firmicutes bacterium]|nr:23S rRNA (uracil(1939)-C(5))-methyltransferase RlmD [Bacillota bacterium]
MPTAVPVKKGQEIELAIEDLSHDGQGVGRYQGFTIFVPQAIPGDRVRAEIISLQKNYARGLITAVIAPSHIRCKPACGIFSACGGCQLQHLPYQEQLEFKRRVVVESLARIGKLQGVTVHPTLGMKDPWHYRNKAQIPLGRKGKEIVAGYYAPRSHRIIGMPPEGCRIQHPLINKILAEMRRLIAKYRLTTYSEERGTGLLRHLFVRVGKETGEAMVVLVINGSQLPKGKAIARELMAAVPQVVSFGISINTRQTNLVLGDKFRLLAGKETITDYIGPFRFEISALSFFQVNPVQTEVLYNKAVEYAALTGREEVVDAYCGIGTISLFLARKAKLVVGIETVGTAIRDAKANARRNGVTNVDFITGDVDRVLPDLWERGFRPDVIVLDPPRKGCAPSALDTFARIQPDRIVYVSCNPTTLARDLGYLAQRGYKVQEIQPVDMFPQTAHVECVVLMTRV